MSVTVKIEPYDENSNESIAEDKPNCVVVKNEFDGEIKESHYIIQQNPRNENKVEQQSGPNKQEIDKSHTNMNEKWTDSSIKSNNHIATTKLKETYIKEHDLIQYKTENNAYKCPVCSKLLYYKSHFEKHLEMHNRPSFSCSICHQKFKKEKNYNKHVESHKDRKYQCDQCDNRYKNQAKLTQHKKIHDTKNPLKCTICNKTFINALCMTRHKQVCPQLTTCEHADLKNNILQCEECKKKNKVKWVYCRICKKRFDDLASLRPHQKTHRGEKPYQCDVCQRHFSTKSNMQRHSELHEKPKKLTCPICSKWFPLESKVIYHMGTHAKIQPFHCKICPKKFSHKINATRHYQVKHPNEKFDSDVSYGSFAKAVVLEMQSNSISKEMETNESTSTDQSKMIKVPNEEATPCGKFEAVFVKAEPLDYEE